MVGAREVHFRNFSLTAARTVAQSSAIGGLFIIESRYHSGLPLSNYGLFLTLLTQPEAYVI